MLGGIRLPCSVSLIAPEVVEYVLLLQSPKDTKKIKTNQIIQVYIANIWTYVRIVDYSINVSVYVLILLHFPYHTFQNASTCIKLKYWKSYIHKCNLINYASIQCYVLVLTESYNVGIFQISIFFFTFKFDWNICNLYHSYQFITDTSDKQGERYAKYT